MDLLTKVKEDYYEIECEIDECKNYLNIEDIENYSKIYKIEELNDLWYRVLAQHKCEQEFFKYLSIHIFNWWD